MSEPLLVIGVGNRLRSDDGAGPRVLDALRDGGCSAELVEVAGDCAALIDLWEGRERVIVVDATRSGTTPGTVVRLDAIARPIPAETFIHTSHAFGVAEAVETARALGRLPESLIVWGIEGAEFGFGEDLTPAVQAAVEAVAAEIGDG